MKVYIKDRFIGVLFREFPDIYPNDWTFHSIVDQCDIVNTLQHHFKYFLELYQEYKLVG